MKMKEKSKALRQLNKRIDLSKLTPAERRVVIAQDVIAALVAKRLNAERGTYLRGPVDVLVNEGDDLRPLIGKMRKCTVCALGAVFVAKVARFNDFSVTEQTDNLGVEEDRETMHANLRAFFSVEQLESIECAFEKSRGFICDSTLTSADGERAAEFGIRLGDVDAVRMRGIMQNIIDNKGEFRP